MMKSLYILLPLLLSCCFCVNADSWIQKGNFSGGGRDGAVEFVIAEKGYIASGNGYNDTWEYEPATDAWTQKAAFPGAGGDYGAGFSIGDKGYLGTGQITNGFTDEFWEYDPATNTWTQKANFAGNKRSGAFAFSIGNKGYLGGGATNYAKEDFWEYDPTTDAWTQLADYGGGKVGGQAGFLIADKAYIGTGRDNMLFYRNDFWEYDPATNLWTQKADFPGENRALGVGLTINGLGYLGLGVTIDMQVLYLSDFWQYDPAADSWSQQTDYPGDFGGGASALVIDSIAYIGLGGSNGKDWWQYDPDSIATAADDEFIKQKPPAVYPNPSDGTFKVSLLIPDKVTQSTVIDILDQAGKVVSSLQTTFQDGLLDQQISVKHLPAGFFWVRVRDGGRTFTAKLILQKQ